VSDESRKFFSSSTRLHQLTYFRGSSKSHKFASSSFQPNSAIAPGTGKSSFLRKCGSRQNHELSDGGVPTNIFAPWPCLSIIVDHLACFAVRNFLHYSFINNLRYGPMLEIHPDMIFQCTADLRQRLRASVKPSQSRCMPRYLASRVCASEKAIRIASHTSFKHYQANDECPDRERFRKYASPARSDRTFPADHSMLT
jgi:hypothetical protein